MPARVGNSETQRIVKEHYLQHDHESSNSKHLPLIQGYRWLMPSSIQPITGVWTKGKQYQQVTVNAGAFATCVVDWPAVTHWAPYPRTRKVTEMFFWIYMQRTGANYTANVYNSRLNGTPAAQTDTFLYDASAFAPGVWTGPTATVNVTLTSTVYEFLYIKFAVAGGGIASIFRIGPMYIKIE